MPVSPLELARFKRQPIRTSDVWQGGVVRLPMWITENEDDAPYRARGVFWFSTRTGLVWANTEPAPRTAGVDLAMRGLLDFAKKYDRDLLGRPSRIEMTDAALADALRAALGDPETTIAVVTDLPNVREALRAFEKFQTKGEALPAPLLESPGVTLKGLRGFADAAARFYQANVWDALTPDEDLVAVEQPVVDPALQHFVVTGSTREIRGLTFFPSRPHFERFLANPPGPGRRKPQIWLMSFEWPDGLPFGDVDAWTDHHLPVAAPDAYPRPGLIEGNGGLGRPDGVRLAFLETVLRALADSTGDDFDSGRWTRRVDTVGGPVEVRLALPCMLEAIAADSGNSPSGDARSAPHLQTEQLMRVARKAIEASGATSIDDVRAIVGSLMNGTLERDAPSDPTTPLEQAQALAYAAMDAKGRYQVVLARRAIKTSADCADAWAILGNRAPSAAAAVQLYREAVGAGERALGSKYFDEEAGHFWGLVETRPYMRARFALADALSSEGAVDEAVTHYRELLRLNPGDNQGVRYTLLQLLIEQDRDADARALLDQFDVDEGASWLYTSALVAFRLAEKTADDRLDRALAANRHVPRFLTGEKEIPEPPAFYGLGSIEEATIAADLLVDAWTSTPGAIFWLNTRRQLKKPSGGKRRSKGPRSQL